MRQRIDHLRQVIFEELLPVRAEERDDLDIVGGIRGDETEISDGAGGIDGDSLQAGRHGPIVLLRIGVGRVVFELDLAVRDIGVTVEQFPHALRILGVLGALFGQLPRQIEAHDDRFFDGLQDRDGPRRQRVEAILGEVYLGRSKRLRRKDVERNEEHDGDHDRRQGQRAALVSVQFLEHRLRPSS